MYILVSLLIATASFIASAASAFIARNSLQQTKRIADRDRADWIQRKWFDLSFEADRAYDALDRFQALYAGGLPSPHSVEWPTFVNERNELMFMLRRVYSMAVVFPINPAIDKLLQSTKEFSDNAELLSKDRLANILNAVDNIRSKALIRDTSILA